MSQSKTIPPILPGTAWDHCKFQYLPLPLPDPLLSVHTGERGTAAAPPRGRGRHPSPAARQPAGLRHSWDNTVLGYKHLCFSHL